MLKSGFGPNGVQGVRSSNLLVPTSNIKGLRAMLVTPVSFPGSWGTQWGTQFPPPPPVPPPRVAGLRPRPARLGADLFLPDLAIFPACACACCRDGTLPGTWTLAVPSHIGMLLATRHQSGPLPCRQGSGRICAVLTDDFIIEAFAASRRCERCAPRCAPTRLKKGTLRMPGARGKRRGHGQPGAAAPAGWRVPR